MHVEPIATHPASFTSEKLLTLVSQLSGTLPPWPGVPPRPPGPFDFLFRSSTKAWIASAFARVNPAILDWLIPHSFRAAEGSFAIAASELNPQPLPPRHSLIRAIGQTFLDRAALLNELAGAVASNAEKHGIIIVSGYVDRFVKHIIDPGFKLPLRVGHIAGGHAASDEWVFLYDEALCPLPRHIPIHRPFYFPFPTPPLPDPWWRGELNGLDLVVLAAEFSETAKRTHDDELRRGFANAAAQLANAGAARAQ